MSPADLRSMAFPQVGPHMLVSDFYVRREARRLIERFGDEALAEARATFVKCARDDVLAADTWLRIVARIVEMVRERAT